MFDGGGKRRNNLFRRLPETFLRARGIRYKTAGLAQPHNNVAAAYITFIL